MKKLPVKLPYDVVSYLPLEVKGRITEIESKILGIHKTEEERPYIALKYYQPSYKCFSEIDNCITPRVLSCSFLSSLL